MNKIIIGNSFSYSNKSRIGVIIFCIVSLVLGIIMGVLFLPEVSLRNPYSFLLAVVSTVLIIGALIMFHTENQRSNNIREAHYSLKRKLRNLDPLKMITGDVKVEAVVGYFSEIQNLNSVNYQKVGLIVSFGTNSSNELCAMGYAYVPQGMNPLNIMLKPTGIIINEAPVLTLDGK